MQDTRAYTVENQKVIRQESERPPVGMRRRGQETKKGAAIRIVYALSGFKRTYEEYLEHKKQNEETFLKYPVSVVKLIYRIIKRPGDVVFPENQEF